jgi:hypothetical protein
MLTELDENLMHQAGVPAVHTANTDHRFFDRVWWSAYDPEGGRGLNVGMSAYKNMDATDGYAIWLDDVTQTNVRVSRPLTPDYQPVIGPLRIEWVKPMKEYRLILDTDELPMRFDVTWTASTGPFDEGRHWHMAGPRYMYDYWRYDGAGFAQGTVEVGGETVTIDRWPGQRDHSWGNRPGIGGFEPNVANPWPDGLFYQWLVWGNDDVAGYVQIHRDGQNRPVHSDATIRYIGEGGKELKLLHGEIDVEFVPGTRVYSKAVCQLHMHDGSYWEVVAEPLTKSMVYHGSGYDLGFNDGRGLGVRRSELTVEADVYDLSDFGEPLLLPSRTPVARAFHREQPAAITFNGDRAVGHFVVIPVSPLPQFDFKDDSDGHIIYAAAADHA